MSEPRSDFLSRWSRRKALQQEETDQLTISEGAGQEDELPVVSEEEEAPALTDDDMPPLETLGEDDSYSGFLSPEVSEKLRKVALRQLFHGAGFNIRDGLDDYDEDFTIFKPLGDIITADMRHREEMLERKAKEALARKNEDSDDSITAIAEKDEADEGPPSDEEAYDADATDSDLVEHPSDVESGRTQPGVSETDEKVALVDQPIDDDSSQNPKNSKDNESPKNNENNS
ncbi:MAG: DUF3306 domain-containing protein [Acidiferrobacteraceae bacterium]|nr:DUF3306 domain-containing protein [Acidiferrobacteraceae bacterium]MBT3973606.1 DUF3306 domain-containing protein [Acidiferrobacteraceae bacterium]